MSDRALMWGEAVPIRHLNQSLCVFNWPSFPSLSIPLPLLYSVWVIYMESKAKWTHDLLYWCWKRADGLVLFWPPRTSSLDMTDLKNLNDLREQLQYGSLLHLNKLQYGYIFKNHVQFLIERVFSVISLLCPWLSDLWLPLPQAIGQFRKFTLCLLWIVCVLAFLSSLMSISSTQLVFKTWLSCSAKCSLHSLSLSHCFSFEVRWCFEEFDIL